MKYWGLGNEIWGDWQIGHKDATEYAKVAHESGKMMKWVDPSIELVLSGWTDPKWNRTAIEKNYGLAKYISFHRYDGDDTYYGTLAAPKLLEKDIEVTAATIKSAKYHYKPWGTLFIEPVEDMYIAVDEWNIWYRKGFEDKKRKGESYTEEFYNLRDALYSGIVLNTFQRHCNEVKIANLAQLVNTIGAIYTTPNKSFYQPIYWPLKIYREHCQNVALEVFVDSPSYNSEDFKETGKNIKDDYQKIKDVPFLDVATSINENEDILTLCIINRYKDNDIETDIGLKGFSPGKGKVVYEINGSKGPMAYSLRATGPDISDTEYDPKACFVKEKDVKK